MSERLPVRKTYKLFVGGAFVRSESGRYDSHAGFHVPRGSRKDVRDAVKAARGAAAPWAARTAYNRGQILYRAAEALESRAAEIGAGREEVDAAIDVLVHYAGWTDKLQPVLGGINPVAAPFLSFSLPEPTGVVGIVAPEQPALLGLVGELAPALAAGNTVVAILSEPAPLPGLDLAEVLGVSDLPGGVVNLLCGRRAELAPALAGHRDLNAIVDCSGDSDLGAEIDRLAAESVTRVRHAGATSSYGDAVRDPLAPGGRDRAQDRLAPDRRMSARTRAALGSVVFLFAAPGVAAGLVPWLLTGWESSDPPLVLKLAGLVLIAGGLAMLLPAFARFVFEGIGTPAPVAPPEKLVVGGLYRHVRNPMYVAVTAIIIGQALLLGRPVLLLYALAFMAAVASFVHFYEEPVLSARYGEQYDEYRRAVPAWWPRLRGW